MNVAMAATGDSCGDPMLEACDDGNNLNNDGCSATCVVEECWTGGATPQACASQPKNGGGSFFPTCKVEGTGSGVCVEPVCGNGVLEPGDYQYSNGDITKSCDDG